MKIELFQPQAQMNPNILEFVRSAGPRPQRMGQPQAAGYHQAAGNSNNTAQSNNQTTTQTEKKSALDLLFGKAVQQHAMANENAPPKVKFYSFFILSHIFILHRILSDSLSIFVI